MLPSSDLVRSDDGERPKKSVPDLGDGDDDDAADDDGPNVADVADDSYDFTDTGLKSDLGGSECTGCADEDFVGVDVAKITRCAADAGSRDSDVAGITSDDDADALMKALAAAASYEAGFLLAGLYGVVTAGSIDPCMGKAKVVKEDWWVARRRRLGLSERSDPSNLSWPWPESLLPIGWGYCSWGYQNGQIRPIYPSHGRNHCYQLENSSGLFLHLGYSAALALVSSYPGGLFLQVLVFTNSWEPVIVIHSISTPKPTTGSMRLLSIPDPGGQWV